MTTSTFVRFLAVLAAASSFAGCIGPCRVTPARSEPRISASTRDAIHAANQRLMELFNARDTLAVARMYSDDALMISDSGERYSGRAEIDAYWHPPARAAARGDPPPTPPPPPLESPPHWSLRVLDLDGTDDMPIQRGRSILRSTWQGRPSVSDAQFVVIWQRQSDGTYRIAVDAWWPTAVP